MKNKLIFTLIILLILVPFAFTQAFSSSEVNITKDGTASISSAKIIQVAGSTFFARLYWGDLYLRLTIKTTSSTKFFRGTGELTTLSEISTGDIVDASGQIDSGSDVLTLTALSIKNSSVQKKQTTFSGKVTGVDLSGRKFMLDVKNFGVITVNINATTQFTKGSRTLDLEHVKVGDIITKTAGDYDLSTKTLVANTVLTYVDLSYYKPKNFEGVLKEVSGTVAPTSIKVLINGVSFVINITDKTSILSKNRNSTLLSRFILGDTIRIYGAIREVDDPIIDAGIIRNISL
ncbi:MAG: DUF5666 domain-containing protein [Candidatus Zambryskibacteria bacterium]|nr:DUF5666 domain-containing protein [Candidatus Zambryskibacteria bacterium]